MPTKATRRLESPENDDAGREEIANSELPENEGVESSSRAHIQGKEERGEWADDATRQRQRKGRVENGDSKEHSQTEKGSGYEKETSVVLKLCKFAHAAAGYAYIVSGGHPPLTNAPRPPPYIPTAARKYAIVSFAVS